MLSLGLSSAAQDQSVARQWNELLLESIRQDFARPIVHARNLFHISAAMYDAWAAYEQGASPYFLGQEHLGEQIVFNTDFLEDNINKHRLQEEAISYAAYRLINHRFRRSPGWDAIKRDADALMTTLGYDTKNRDSDYMNGEAAELGNYIAEQIIAYGLADGSNERQNYRNTFYSAVNDPLKYFCIGKPGPY